MLELQYPIGIFQPPEQFTEAWIEKQIELIEELPHELRRAVSGLTEEQLDTPYRPEGWTLRQVVHHLADSHMNSYIRFKWALTEDNPKIKTYDEQRWAELSDGRDGPVDLSLALLDALHDRWTLLLRSLCKDDWNRQFLHPHNGAVPLKYCVGLYAWHGRHHTAHIRSLRERTNW